MSKYTCDFWKSLLGGWVGSTCALAALHAACGSGGSVGGARFVCFAGGVGAHPLHRPRLLISPHGGGRLGGGVGGARLVGFARRVGAHPLHRPSLIGPHAGGRLGGGVGGARFVGFAGRVGADRGAFHLLRGDDLRDRAGGAAVGRFLLGRVRALHCARLVRAHVGACGGGGVGSARPQVLGPEDPRRGAGSRGAVGGGRRGSGGVRGRLRTSLALGSAHLIRAHVGAGGGGGVGGASFVGL